jgi:type II secretory pathway component PulF
MDFNKEPEKAQQYEVDATDYMVEGVSSGFDVLKELKSIKVSKDDDVIYGVYDSSKRGLFDRINDFFIDRSRVSLKEKSYFFHMLAVMVDAGIPVVKAVESLASRAENPRFRRVLNTIAYNCEHGSKLNEAMNRFEDIFDEAEIGIVRSGEEVGRLDSMLFKLSEQLDKRNDLYMKLWGAAVYPIAVLLVLVIVAVGMLVWVFPTLLNMLQEGGVSGDSLPLPTKILISLQSGLVNFWWAILIFVFGLYGVFNIYVSSEYGAVRWDGTKLKLPLVGNILKKVYVLRFVSLLGLLIDSGLPVIKCLKISGGALSNRIYKLQIQEVLNRVKDGGKISETLMENEYLFPAEVTQMLRVGETSATLGKISQKISDQYDREVDNTLKKITSVFEPVMILFVGVFVALLALAIMAPIFNLSSALT